MYDDSPNIVFVVNDSTAQLNVNRLEFTGSVTSTRTPGEFIDNLFVKRSYVTTIFGQINSFLDYENEVLTPDWLNSGHEIPSQGEKLQPSKRLSRFFPSFRDNLTMDTL